MALKTGGKKKALCYDELDTTSRRLITVAANSDEEDGTKMSCSTIKAGTSDTPAYNKVLQQARNDSALNSLRNVPVIRRIWRRRRRATARSRP